MPLVSLCPGSMGDIDSTDLASVLIAIETEMRQLGLWQSSEPEIDAFNSEMPFHCDTLAFNQWLQFVLIVRFRAIIESHSSLPTTCNISPYAEEMFYSVDQDTTRLLDLIRELDSFFCND